MKCKIRQNNDHKTCKGDILICFTTIPQGEGMEAELSVDGDTPIQYTFQQDPGKTFAGFFYAPELKEGVHTATLKVTKLPAGTIFYCGQLLIIDDPGNLPYDDKDGDGV